MPTIETRSDPSGLLAVADQLVRDCAGLVERLAALEVPDLTSADNHASERLAAVEPLRARISRGAATLQQALEGGARLSPEFRERLTAQLAESGRLLREAAAAYSRTVRQVSCMLDEVARQLLDLQRGDRMLRTYAANTRAAG
ncbi:MAG: hypothetical protein ACYTFZ_00020 [Planctomycetota bacterium]